MCTYQWDDDMQAYVIISQYGDVLCVYVLESDAITACRILSNEV